MQADKATRLTVELRSSSHRGNYTPDTTDKRLVFDLREGENRLTVDFGMRYDAPQYVFICFMANPDVSIPMSSEIVSGLTSVFNTVNPAVSNFGRQTPPEDIGVGPTYSPTAGSRPPTTERRRSASTWAKSGPSGKSGCSSTPISTTHWRTCKWSISIR